MSQPVIFKVNDHVARLTLNRPRSGNAINEEMAQEIISICQEINHNDDIYVVIITGAGREAFCKGSDVDYLNGLPLTRMVAGIECPTIAAINGKAYGMGLELALACDIRLAVEGAAFCLPQVASGMVPCQGGTQFLPRIIGRGRALEMLLTAQVTDTLEAHRIGLVGQVVPRDSFLPKTEEIARKMAASGPIALRFAKEAIHKGLDLTTEQGMRLEADLYFLIQTTADRTEGIRAFLEKRTPRFRGE